MVPGLPGGDVAEEVGDDALGQVVSSMRLLTAGCCSLGTRPQWPPITRATSPSWPRWLRPRSLTVALAGGVYQGEAAGLAWPCCLGLFALEEAFFEGDRDVLREADADEAAGGDGVAVLIRRTARGRRRSAGIGGQQRLGDRVTGTGAWRVSLGIFMGSGALAAGWVHSAGVFGDSSLAAGCLARRRPRTPEKAPPGRGHRKMPGRLLLAPAHPARPARLAEQAKLPGSGIGAT